MVSDIVFSFGVILPIGFQQLYSVDRAEKATKGSSQRTPNPTTAPLFNRLNTWHTEGKHCSHQRVGKTVEIEAFLHRRNPFAEQCVFDQRA